VIRTRIAEGNSKATRTGGPTRADLRLGVVVAVRNEARWLAPLLTSLKEQEKLENVCCVAVVDGRSEDESRSIIDRWKAEIPTLQLLDNEARIAPVGFNLGIQACLKAGADAVLVLSGHSALHAGYVVEAERVLASGEAAIVGCVLDYTPPQNAFERASRAFVESRLGRRLGGFSKLRDLQETEIATFPVIRREVFERIGLFDETMVRNQDIEFTTRARRAGFRIVTSPKMKCRYAPPPTFGRLLRQMYGNGLWVGRRLTAHGPRHLAPAAFFGFLLLAGGLAVLKGGAWAWLVACLGSAYLLSILVAAGSWLGTAGRGALWLALIFPCAHGAYALGTLRGLFSRGDPSAIPRG
jgi:succinoglycan biosynthesis protein ExoA